jgi:hypothetical protein
MKDAMRVAGVAGDDVGVAQYAQQAMYFTLWVRLNTSAMFTVHKLHNGTVLPMAILLVVWPD